MFGVGLPELAVLAVVAVIVFGPDRMPELARQAAKLLHQVRTFARRAQDELRSELGPEYSDLRLTDLDPRTAIRRHVREALDELDLEDALRGGPADLQRPGMAPLLPAERPPFDPEAT